MMNIFVGTGWTWVFGVLFFGLIIGAVWWLIWFRTSGDGYEENWRQEKKIKTKKKPINAGSVVLLVLAVVCFFFWVNAGTHFRVPINKRVLMVNTIDQTVIGVKDRGVQKKSFIGVSRQEWPANTQYQINVSMSGGTQAATTKNGTSVYDDVVIYVDLSNMDIAAAYKAVNGEWEAFLQKNLGPGLLSVSRSVSSNFSTNEHTIKRDEWEKQFEAQVKDYLADENKGFNIQLIEGRTVLSWDFVNAADATAYDEANRAAYEITKNQNEKAALEIEAQMVEIRNNMTSQTADGTVVNLDKISKYLQSQPVEIRPYLMDYLNNMENMEYLRIVGDGDYDVILPPNGSAIVSTDSNAAAASQTTNQPSEDKK